MLKNTTFKSIFMKNWGLTYNLMFIDSLCYYCFFDLIFTFSDHDISKLINSDEIFLPITQRSCVENKESLCHLR